MPKHSMLACLRVLSLSLSYFYKYIISIPWVFIPSELIPKPSLYLDHISLPWSLKSTMIDVTLWNKDFL